MLVGTDKSKNGDKQPTGQMAALRGPFIVDESIPDGEIWIVSHDQTDVVKLKNIGEPELPKCPPPQPTFKI